jgi:hypothetical protein
VEGVAVVMETFCRGYLDEKAAEMSNGTIGLIVLGAILLYTAMAGVTQRAIGWDVGNDGPWGLFWPFLLPWIAGEALVSRLVRPRLPKATAKERAS